MSVVNSVEEVIYNSRYILNNLTFTQLSDVLSGLFDRCPAAFQ